MEEVIKEKKVLPPFRNDIKLFLGPDAADGSPTYTVHDPIKGDYWKISWPESLVLQYYTPGMTVEKLVELINTHTTCQVTVDEVTGFFSQAKAHNLLRVEKSSDQLHQEWEATRKSNWSFLTNLFVRIPLLNPDKFLTKTLPYVLFLVSKPALLLYALFSLVGIGMVFQNLERYFSTFSYFFNFEGLIAYITTIVIVKTIHEFSHAYTARNYGVSVPTMGVLFVVIWPMLYTDITNSWKLWNRKQRIAITSAGVASELVLAGISTFVWAFTEPGVLNSASFLVSSVTWITSLFINLNPAIKFDGYLLLADVWGIDNLQPRSFAVTRWKILNGILGYELDNPEPKLPKSQLNGMFAYGIFTWCYRFFVYFYIAYFIYSNLAKVFGIILSLVVIWNFIVYPLLMEFFNFKKQDLYLQHPYRFKIASLLIGIALLGLILPLPQTITVEGITAPVASQVIYAPEDAVLKEVFVKNGAVVKKGERLAVLYSPKLEFDRVNAKSKVKELEAATEMFRNVEKMQDLLKSKQEELEAAKINLKKVEGQIKELQIVSVVNGKVSNWKEGLKKGLPISKGDIIFDVIDEQQIKVIGFVPEKKFRLLSEGQKAEFCLNHHRKCYSGKINQVYQVRETQLDYPQMASTFGGELLTTQITDKSLAQRATLIESFYAIDLTIEASGEEIGFGQRGYVNISGKWRSQLLEWMKGFWGLLVRESGI